MNLLQLLGFFGPYAISFCTAAYGVLMLIGKVSPYSSFSLQTYSARRAKVTGGLLIASQFAFVFLWSSAPEPTLLVPMLAVSVVVPHLLGWAFDRK
jgi:hypothetical protein